MRSSALLILAAFVADATASSNYTFPAGFNLGEVKPTDLQAWCLAERNTCPMVCGGPASQNDCDPTTLNFDCACSNGTTPDLSPYQNTIPFFVCQENYKQCINNHPQDADAQKQCKANATCGTILLTGDATTTAASSTSAPSTTAASNSAATTMATSAAATSPSGSGSATGSGAAASSTSHAAAALLVSSDHATGFFATALVAVFGLLL